jgi:hypothetical protein
MAKLAIKGHATRGKEVIQLLEMFGGWNYNHWDGKTSRILYFINGDMIEVKTIRHNTNIDEFNVFTLEEFLEKYPYKVGDRVSYRTDKLLETQVITHMRWDSNYDCVLYYLDNCNIITVDDILYKIGSPEDNIPTIQDKSTVETIKEDIGTFKPSEGTLVQIDFTKELRIADEVEVILGDYEFVLKDGKTYFVKKNKYPTTYGECCDILGYDPSEDEINCYKGGLIESFVRLLICRNAYWKIAGEQMGLDKPWEPDWESYKDNFCIITYKNKPIRYEIQYRNRILAFPTEEMRDEFYKNYKDLIESCKELL